MNYNTKTPCMDCENHAEGCHSGCQAYKEWKAEHEAKRQAYHKKQKEWAAFQDYVASSYSKMHSRGSARWQQKKDKGIRRVKDD